MRPRGPSPATDPFEAAVGRALRALGARDGDGAVVAFSGGPDSCALLAAAAALGDGTGPRLRLVAAHLDHGLRPGSAAEARAARSLARRLRVPFRLRRARSLAPAGGGSPEAAARKARYAFLAEAAARVRARWVLVAHQRDDRVETVLHRLLQGAALGGLAGIPPSRPLPGARGVRVLRPLLDLSRAEVRDYLRRRKLAAVEDPTNAGDGNARARLRSRVLPALRRVYPGADAALLRLEGICADARSLASGAAERAATRLRKVRGGARVPRSAFAGLGAEATRLLLARLLSAAGAARAVPPEAALARFREAMAAADGRERLVPVTGDAELRIGAAHVSASGRSPRPIN
jgi:tRNA(Ile)-lysidine synthase